MLKPSGSWVAIPTPFDTSDRIDYEGFAEIIDFQAKHGSSALLVMGSTGEATMLSAEERYEIVRRVTPMAKGKVPLFFGTTCSTTKETVRLSQYAEEQAADGVLFVVPPYLVPPQESVFRFLKTAMDSVTIPAAIYNNPTRVVVNIDPMTIKRLADECPNFVADKEAMGRVQQLAEVISLTRGRIHVLCCDYPNYSIALPTLALGGHGTANITGNIMPEEMVRMSRPWETMEDVQASRDLFFRSYRLSSLLYHLTNPVAVKAAMTVLGLPSGKPRPPLPEMSPERVAELRQVMDEMGVLDRYGKR